MQALTPARLVTLAALAAAAYVLVSLIATARAAGL